MQYISLKQGKIGKKGLVYLRWRDEIKENFVILTSYTAFLLKDLQIQLLVHLFTYFLFFFFDLLELKREAIGHGNELNMNR
jgi:hypothetical protein